jgi:hypothetical protein
MHPYAGGNVSDLDKERFSAVNALEQDRFALISTKKALERYRNWGSLDKFVRKSDPQMVPDDDNNRVSNSHQALHYSIIKSSNEFETEELGVVAGMPFPSDDLVRIWSGFCGQAVDLSDGRDEDDDKSFGEFGDKIYEHFAHKQVVQAALRFGRADSVYEDEGSTVYISTYALPDWLEVDEELTIESKAKQAATLAKLFEIRQREDKPKKARRTVRQIHDEITSDEDLPNPSERGTRRGLNNLASTPLVIVKRDAGMGQADVFRLGNDAELIESSESDYFIKAGTHLHSLDFDGSWHPSRS